MNDDNGPIGVTRTSSKGTSLRITLPKEVAARLNVKENQYIGFFLEDGKIVVKRIIG